MSVSPAHRDMVHKALYIFVLLDGQCSIFDITWAHDLFDPEFPANNPVGIYSDTEKSRRRRVAEFRVSETKGLLQITYGDGVVLFHRTTHDFLSDPQRMADMFAKVPSTSKAELQLKSYLAHLWLVGSPWCYGRTHLRPPRNLKSVYRAWDDAIEEKHRWLDNLEAVAYYYRTANVEAFSYGSVFTTCSILFDGAKVQSTVTTHYSHLHYVVTSVGDFDYIRHRLEDNPRLMHTDGIKSMLFSAIVGLQVNLVEYLFHKGVSPNELINLRGRKQMIAATTCFKRIMANGCEPGATSEHGVCKMMACSFEALLKHNQGGSWTLDLSKCNPKLDTPAMLRKASTLLMKWRQVKISNGAR